MSSEFVGDFISKTKKQFLKYNKYIIDNDWSDLKTLVAKKKSAKAKKVEDDENKTSKRQEFDIQNDLAKGILDRVKYFVKKTENIKRTKPALNFIKESLDIIDIHTNRVDSYINTIDISEIENIDLRSDEIAFHNHIFKQVSSIQDTISGLNIKFEESSDTSSIEFLNGMKAPLSMHKTLCELYPEINTHLEKKGIDFECDPGDSLLILDPNPPRWDASLHYWEQEADVLQYYVNEFKKIERGVRIDGYYLSGWAYYHMNVFVTPIPQNVWNPISERFESEDKVMCPPLRDSDLIIFENHERQIKENIMFMFIAATRRAAKTTTESSKLDRAITVGKKQILCAGGSTKDLNQIGKNIRISMQYKNPAFAVYNVSNDWTDKIEIGLKTKANKTILLSTLNIVNTSKGTSSASEILAGYTPDEFVYDEILKSSFISTLAGLKPALRGKNGSLRAYGILSGTGGNEALSADGLAVLSNPTENDILPMQWDLLERGVPEHLRTWEEDRLKPFGTFLPGQMCVDMYKNESSLGEYIGRHDSEKLKKIPIQVTDWEKSTAKAINDLESKIGNRLEYQKQMVYIPLKPSSIFASGKESPFPIAEAKAHRQYLLETGLWDRRRNLYKDSSGKIIVEISTKELAPFPHKGGNIDAPFLIFEDPPTEKVKNGTYAAGFDDYKHDDSTSASLATFYVMKNEIIGDPFSNKLVASLSFKPERHSTVHEKWLLLMEAYQLDGTCFGENEDYTIKDYLDRRHLADKYLAASLDFTQTFNLPNNLKRKSGWTPQSSKRQLFRLFVEYCNEEFEVEQEDGSVITLKGVQRIDDIGLLDEIIAWSENLNVDKITGIMGANAFLHYLRSSFRWKVTTAQVKYKFEETAKEKVERNRNFYNSSARNRSFYGKNRR